MNKSVLTSLLKSPLPGDSELLERAYDFAERAHAGQKRGSGDPYFLHVFEVAKTLAELGMDAKTIAAGLLHDTIEDTDATEADVEREFGSEIFSLVQGVTKLGKLKYKGRERYVESLRKFFIAIALDVRVLIIKLADRLHNVKTLEHVREEKRGRIALETIEIHAPLAGRLGMGRLRGELEDHAFPHALPDKHALVEKLLAERSGDTRAQLEEIAKSLETTLTEQGVAFSALDFRIKHKYSLYRKLSRNDMDIDKVHDIVALRVIVNSLEDCYRVLGIIHSKWTPVPGRLKDYIAVPKPSGYRSLHTTIMMPGGGIAEIQVRTAEMHQDAEYGVAAHFMYKEHRTESGTFSGKKPAWLAELEQIQKTIKDSAHLLENLKMDFFQNRIFVFTPGNDVVDMPEDSTPVDFAYAIHTDLGNTASGAKVNGRMVSLDTKLKNGDIVEIITRKDGKPNMRWLDFTKTTLAKKHIRSHAKTNGLLNRFLSFGQKS